MKACSSSGVGWCSVSSYGRRRWKRGLRLILSHSAPGCSQGGWSPPLEELFVLMAAFAWVCLLQTFRQVSPQEVSEMKKPSQRLMQIYVCQRDLLWKYLKVALKVPCIFRVNVQLKSLTYAVSPGLHLLKETGLDHPHLEGGSWQHSVPSALWQTFTWDLPDLWTHPWIPQSTSACTGHCRDGGVGQLCTWFDFVSHYSCFIQVHRWMGKFMSLICSLYPEH